MSRPRRAAGAQRRGAAGQLLQLLVTVVVLGGLALLAARLDKAATRQTAGDAAIVDGDTLALRGERIRLLGIDAPEMDQECEKDGAAYACGRQAKTTLARMVGGRDVSCEGWRHDIYGRLLATCSAGGRDLNREMVAQGWAVAYGGYEAEERAARSGRLGLWAGRFEAPKDWRHGHRGLDEPYHGTGAAIRDWLRAAFGLS